MNETDTPDKHRLTYSRLILKSVVTFSKGQQVFVRKLTYSEGHSSVCVKCRAQFRSQNLELTHRNQGPHEDAQTLKPHGEIVCGAHTDQYTVHVVFYNDPKT